MAYRLPPLTHTHHRHGIATKFLQKCGTYWTKVRRMRNKLLCYTPLVGWFPSLDGACCVKTHPPIIRCWPTSQPWTLVKNRSTPLANRTIFHDPFMKNKNILSHPPRGLQRPILKLESTFLSIMLVTNHTTPTYIMGKFRLWFWEIVEFSRTSVEKEI